MNYIRHLSAFFEQVACEERFTPFHISLYIALFQLWNVNRFRNPVSVSRLDLMQLSRIGSTHTYYKCLKELERWGYIAYHPSKNPLKGSLVDMCIFSTSDAHVVHHSSSKNGTSRAYLLHPSINSINILNSKHSDSAQSENKEKNVQGKGEKSTAVYKSASKRTKAMVVPTLEEVTAFFQAEGAPELEAQRFFNHFESNGWKVGGRCKMQDWRAAARNWVLNAEKFNPKGKLASSEKLSNSKDYSIPL